MISSGEYFKLWSGDAPGAVSPDIIAPLPTAHTPTLQVFLPEPAKATGASVIVCPGGGYVMLADYEGPDVALWLAQHGITAFVLRYRLGPIYTYPVQFWDVQRALRFVRSHAPSWQLDANRIGILGFSAGGHLASMASTRFSAGDSSSPDPIEQVSSRPDLQILIYPVISFNLTYQSVKVLSGGDPHPDSALLDELSSEKHVRPDTPLAFLVHTDNDTVVPIAHADLYAASLASAGVPCEYIRGSFGEHGYGLHPQWTDGCISWLQKQGFACQC